MTPTPKSLFDNILFDQGMFGGDLAGLSCQSAAGIIYSALRKAAVTLAPQRIPSPAQMKDGLEELNRLIGSLNCDRMFIYALDILELPLQAGKKMYTIGQIPGNPGVADWDFPRPQGISQANVILFNTGTAPLRIPVLVATSQVWSRIQLQELPNAIPQIIYNDHASPLSIIYIWGQPEQDMALELYVWHSVREFQSESDSICLPPGYSDALVLNLAVRLAPQFQRVIDPDVRQQARESLMRLESINAPKPIAVTALGGANVWVNGQIISGGDS